MKNDHRSKFSNLSNWKEHIGSEANLCGFIAQLVEHRTGIAEVTGSNPVEALIFSGFFFPIAQIGKFAAMIILHFEYVVIIKNQLAVKSAIAGSSVGVHRFKRIQITKSST